MIFGKWRKPEPIPAEGSVAGWKRVPIRECGERLVPLGPFSDLSRWILQDSVYWGERNSSPYGRGDLQGSFITPFVRENVARRLVRAASLLPKRHMLLVWDAYRSLDVQKALFDYYVQVLERQGSARDRAVEEAQRFVSIPSSDPSRPSPHNTGGAVDLTVVRFGREAWAEMDWLGSLLGSADWQAVYRAEMARLMLVREASETLDMGTVFDEVSPRTAAAFYERPEGELSWEEKVRRKNRRILHRAMREAGFSAYEEEWWHFDYGNQFWAVKRKVPAIYGAAAFSPEHEAWEEMRRSHFRGSSALGRAGYPETKTGLDEPLTAFVRRTALETGDPGSSVHPRAATL